MTGEDHIGTFHKTENSHRKTLQAPAADMLIAPNDPRMQAGRLSMPICCSGFVHQPTLHANYGQQDGVR